MNLPKLVAQAELLKILDNQAEILRHVRDSIVVFLEDDARIEDVQTLYRSGVGRMLHSAKSQHALAVLTGSEIVKSKASALVTQCEALFRLVA